MIATILGEAPELGVCQAYTSRTRPGVRGLDLYVRCSRPATSTVEVQRVTVSYTSWRSVSVCRWHKGEHTRYGDIATNERGT